MIIDITGIELSLKAAIMILTSRSFIMPREYISPKRAAELEKDILSPIVFTAWMIYPSSLGAVRVMRI